MKEADRLLLEAAAESWIKDNADSIEVDGLIVPLDDIPEGEDESWAMMNGAELDSSFGFKIVPVSVEDGPSGWALVHVKGNSWEELRVYSSGVFSTEAEARDDAAAFGVVVD